MKIGITADTHLQRRIDTKDRYEALEEILYKLQQNKISTLIIAGDAFDKEQQNYSDFLDLAKEFRNINFIIIPGNHDINIQKKFFPSDNIKIITTPTIEEFDSLPIAFFPYKVGITLDAAIAEFAHNRDFPKQWVLIGHGDYIEAPRLEKSYESGFYMPLTYKPLEKYTPMRVFLGHIHAPSSLGKIIYPGSPCPMDINETGKRRFLIYDTSSNDVVSVEISTGKIYMNETLMAFPLENEKDLIATQIERMIAQWNFTNEELKRVLLRLSVYGFSTNLDELKKTIREAIQNKGIKWYDEHEPNLSLVNTVSQLDDERNAIFTKVKEKIDALPFQGFAEKEQIIEKTLQIIYGN